MAAKGPSSSRPIAQNERRRRRRCKITQLMCIRPTDPHRPQFEDVRGTHSVSRDGVYFQTDLASYELGMRLFVTLPFTENPTAVNREYLAEVTRLEPIKTGAYGVGIKLLMEIGPPRPTPPSPRGGRK